MGRTCKVHNPIDICSEKPIDEGGILTSPADVDRSEFALEISNREGIIREGTGRDNYKRTEKWQTTIQVTIKTEFEPNKVVDLVVNKWMVTEIIDIFREIHESESTKNFIFKKITGDESKWTSYQVNPYIACYRHSIVKGTGRNSWHCYGVAIDINAKHNPHSPEHHNSCPECGGEIRDDAIHIRTKDHPIVQVFYKHGWTWGGVWKTPDYMHFCATKG